jgi:hypothetical protein
VLSDQDIYDANGRCRWLINERASFRSRRGYRVAVMVGDDGEQWPILFDTTAGPDGWARCLDCPPEHEEVGPLPDDVWLRLQHGPAKELHPSRPSVRCGRPTRAGVPCRRWTEHASGACYLHREVA